MSEQIEEEKVRRTRGSASVKRKKTRVWMNGKRFRSVPEALNELTAAVKELAEFVDPSGASADMAASSPAASTDRSRYADAASKRHGKESEPRVPSEGDKLPAGSDELPTDSGDFVGLVHALVSLPAAWERLVRSPDLKISQRALEKLSELNYSQSDSGGMEPQQYEIDVTPRERGEEHSI
jgi:hypothetical protein